jgi:hypothetical protein
MKQHGASDLRDVSDGSLRNAILEMGVDPTVRDCLIALLAVLLERVVWKPAVVCVIVLDGYAVICGKSLQCSLGLNHFL